MRNSLGPGRSIGFINTGSAITSGSVVVLIAGAAGFVGIASDDIEATTGGGSLAIEGVFELTALTTDTGSVGDPVYYDATNTRITTAATGNTRAGRLVAPKTNGQTTAQVKLNDSSPGHVINSKTASVLKSAFTDGGGTSGTLLVPALDIPARSIVLGWESAVSVAFNGDTSAILEVGTAADADRFTGSNNPSIFAAATVGSGLEGGDGLLYVGVGGAAVQLQVTGAADFTNVAALGAMIVTIYYLALP